MNYSVGTIVRKEKCAWPRQIKSVCYALPETDFKIFHSRYDDIFYKQKRTRIFNKWLTHIDGSSVWISLKTELHCWVLFWPTSPEGSTLDSWENSLWFSVMVTNCYVRQPLSWNSLLQSSFKFFLFFPLFRTLYQTILYPIDNKCWYIVSKFFEKKTIPRRKKTKKLLSSVQRTLH